MNSWLQRAGVLANFDGFLLRLSHEMRLQAQNTHISEAVKKILQKKPRESSGLGCVRPCEEQLTAERPRSTAETPSAPRKFPPMSRPSFERALLADGFLYECHSEHRNFLYECHSERRNFLYECHCVRRNPFLNVILSAAGRFALQIGPRSRRTPALAGSATYAPGSFRRAGFNGSAGCGGKDQVTQFVSGHAFQACRNRAIILSGFSRCGSSAPKGESR